MSRTILWLCGLLGLVGVAAADPPTHDSVGIGHGIVEPSYPTDPCDHVAMAYYNVDPSVENAYCWQYGGIVAPSYGAFAESYNVTGTACAIELFLTSLGHPCRPLDAHVWQDDNGLPGAVLSLTTGLTPCPLGLWPEVSDYSFAITPTNVNARFWIGYWADFSAQAGGCYIGADLDGPGGTPRTNIAPGIGYPTGWNDVAVVWGPTKGLDILAWITTDPAGACCLNDGTCVMTFPEHCATRWLRGINCLPQNPCSGTPVSSDSWGRIKTLYN